MAVNSEDAEPFAAGRTYNHVWYVYPLLVLVWNIHAYAGIMCYFLYWLILVSGPRVD